MKVRKAVAAAHGSRGGVHPAAAQDPETSAITRLGMVAVLVASFSTVVRLALPQASDATPATLALRLGTYTATVVLSLAVAALAWWRPLPARKLLDIALVYEIVQGLLFAVTFHAISASANSVPRGWSTVAVWVLTFPLVIPATRIKTIVATLLTALMDPLGLAIAVATGSPAPSKGAAVAIFLRTGLAIVGSFLVSRLLHHMSAEVADAREMGAYRLFQRIGQGGMGEVWRAEHRTLARPAAIKLIRPEALAENGRDIPETIERFEREARATAALRSPHTVAVYDFGTAEDGSLYYVMELLDGYDADTLVRRFGPLPPERVVSLVRQVCHSLEEAHRAGLVHRDIKPANILICRLGLDLDFVKVVDFGLVKGTRDSDGGERRLTAARMVAGTPEYMSPETALAHEVDRRSDIYSLGCVAYWLLTARPVFDSGSPMKIAFDHVETPPVPPSKRTERVIPKALEQIVLQCLSKDPGQRPQTADDLARRLGLLGIEGGWTPRHAETWWHDHPPELNEQRTGEMQPVDLTRRTA